jgi:hypothetical protein
MSLLVVFGGLMVILLAIGPKVRGFKPGRGHCIFKGYKKSGARFHAEGK